jgi:hypothetical protein
MVAAITKDNTTRAAILLNSRKATDSPVAMARLLSKAMDNHHRDMASNLLNTDTRIKDRRHHTGSRRHNREATPLSRATDNLLRRAGTRSGL